MMRAQISMHWRSLGVGTLTAAKFTKAGWRSRVVLELVTIVV
jgi:hypothetical protein